MKKPHLSLVFYRPGGDCIERVVVIDGEAHIQKLTTLNALNIIADLSQIAGRIERKKTSPKEPT